MGIRSRAREVLTIAGSDSGGGAGIQADLKTLAALGIYGSSVITAVTAQNTLGVQAVYGMPPALVRQQLSSVLLDIGADAVKTGMLHDAGVVEAVAGHLGSHPVEHLVVDPVLVATSGDRLLSKKGEQALGELLLPLAKVLTPNASEAAVLSGSPIDDESGLRRAAAALQRKGARCVIITGWRQGDCCYDLFFDGDAYQEIGGPYIETRHTHGTGCAFSTALAAWLAYGETPLRAAFLAKAFVGSGLRYGFPVGAGRGSVNHMAAFFPGLWRDERVGEFRYTCFNDWRAKLDLGAEPSLYVIIGGRPRVPAEGGRGRDCLELARAAVASGARLVQLREKEIGTGALVALAVAMRDICHRGGALLIVNDRADVAAASGADGVHLGEDDLTVKAARALLGPGAIIGASASSLEEARAAAAEGADYLGFGPVYPTASKNCKAAPCGPVLLAQAVASVPIPVVAIGGITPGNTTPLLEAGAAGVAVISAFAGAPDPMAAAGSFQQVFSAFTSRKRGCQQAPGANNGVFM